MIENLKAVLDLDINPFKKKAKEAEQSGKRILETITVNGKKVNLVAKSSEELASNMKNTDKATKSFGNNLTKGFDKSINKIKKFGLSLLSVRSIYSVLSRASSAYMQQDQELANKMQSVWVGLGSILAPVIEKISNLLIKAVSYINIFVKALTGVDLIQKAIDKSSKKANSSAKALNKTLAGFDELTNINQENTTLTDTNWTDAFKDVELNQKFVSKLEKLANVIKKNKDELILFGEILLATFGAVKIGQLVGNIGTLLGTGTVGGAGLLGLYATLIALSAIELIVIGIKIKREGDDLEKELQSLRKTASNIYKENVDNMNNMTDILKEQNRMRELGTEAMVSALDPLNKIVGVSDSYLNNVKLAVEQSQATLDKLKQINDIENMNNQDSAIYLDGLIEQYEWNEKKIAQLDLQKQDTTDLKNINSQYKEEIQKVAEKLGISTTKTTNLKNEAGKTGEKFSAVEKSVSDIKEDLKKLDENSTKIKIDADTSSFKKKLNKIFDSKGYSIMSILYPQIGALGSITKWLTSLDVGTNYVPNDQLALIHKGEAVVPKKFNSEEYFNRVGNNDEVINAINNLNQTLIDKNMSVGISYKDVGQASAKYINEATRIQGRSVINI